MEQKKWKILQLEMKRLFAWKRLKLIAEVSDKEYINNNNIIDNK